MPFDAFHLSVIVRELSAALEGGRIDKIQAPHPDALLLGIYSQRKNYRLLLQAQGANPALCFIKAAPDTLPSLTAFALSVKKHLSGGIIRNVTQPPFERTVTLEVDARDELGYPSKKYLIAEIMGRFSNLFLLDENKRILNVLKHYSLDINAKRPQITGSPYLPPPEQEKLEITDQAAFIDCVTRSEAGTLCADIIAAFKGFAPLTVRELIFRAAGGKEEFDTDITFAKRLHGLLLQAFSDSSAMLAPVAIHNKSGVVKDFCAFALTHSPLTQSPFPTLSDAVDHYLTAGAQAQAFSNLQNKLAGAVKKNLTKAEKKLGTLSAKQLECRDYADNKKKGDLLLSSLHLVKQGMTTVTLADYDSETGEDITITLDEKLNPQANAQRYYRKYAKQKRTLEQNGVFLQQAQETAEYLSGLLSDIKDCLSVDELSLLAEELENEGILSAPKGSKKQKKAVSQPYCEEAGNFRIYIGKNNLQNEKLTKSAGGNEYWLHAQQIHGSHVVIKGQNPPQHVILRAAELAAFYSKARHADNVPVDITQAKYVKKPPGSPPGKVIYSNQKTVYVTPKRIIDK